MARASLALVLAGAVTGATAAWSSLHFFRDAPIAVATTAESPAATRSLRAPAASRAGAVASADEVGATVRALVRESAHDPRGAFAAALALPDAPARRWALEKVGSAWAAHDPPAAFDAADRIPADWRERYRARVLEQWSFDDAPGAITFLERIDPRLVPAGLKLQAFVAGDADRMLALAERLPPEQRSEVRWAAFRALAWREPLEVLESVLRMPPSTDRESILRDVAIQYARSDTTAALEWATRTPIPLIGRNVVLSEFARVDIARAADIVATMSGNEAEIRTAAMTVGVAIADVQAARAIADRIVSRNDIRARLLLSSVVSRWTTLDAVTATEWIVAHAADVDTTVLATLGSELAKQDFASAVLRAERLPESLRVVTLTDAAVRGYSEAPAEVVAWMERHAGDRYYDTVFDQILRRVASGDPATAARLFAHASPAGQVQSAPRIASAWWRTDPVAARAWVEAIAVSGAREAALRVLERSAEQQASPGTPLRRAR